MDGIPVGTRSFFLSFLATLAQAQEALRDSIASERASEARKQALENQTFNFKLGPVKFLLGASFDTEFNDNIDLVDSNPESDVILRPQFHTLAVWRVTEVNALTFSMGVGYTGNTIDHDENDSFFMSPESQLLFDVFVKDFRFQFFDQFSYSLDPLTEGSVSGTAQYGGFENTVGVNATWDLNEVIISGNYSHYNFLSGTTEFDYLNRQSDRLVLRTAFVPNASVKFGLETSGELNSYTGDQTLNDSTSYSFGGFGDWRVSDYLTIAANLGYVVYSFDDSGTVGSSDKSDSYYFGLSVNHRVNERISHSLDATHGIQLGVYSDGLELSSIRYNATLKIIKDVGLSTQLWYQRGQYSDTTFFSSGGQPVSLAGESYDRLGVGVSLGYQLMEKLGASLTYRFTFKDSDLPALDYRQNALSLSLTYRF